MIQILKVLILDMTPNPELGIQLRQILEGCTRRRIRIQCEYIAITPRDLTDTSAGAQLDDTRYNIIFLIFPPRSKETVKALCRFWIGKSFETPMIAVFDEDQSSRIVEFLRLGFADFVTPPLKPIDILPRIWRLLESEEEDQKVVRSLREKISLRKLIGGCKEFRDEVEKISVVAKCSASILISGETGTGKELFARAIHYMSPRAGRPFVPTSCGAIPFDLTENELFGHVRGAYTGAESNQPGLIQEAEGGSLFLDEVDCLPKGAQVKLLRLIQEKEYRRLGCAKIRYADVRIIAATNIDLKKAVEKGEFRQDLYYRLNVVPLVIPPLRERRQDIPLLAQHFLARCAHEYNRQITGFSSEAMKKMLAYEWPGNVRELENVVERAAIFSKQQIIQESNIVLPNPEVTSFETVSFSEAKQRFIQTYIQGLLIAHGGNVSQAARAASKDRRAFWELMKKHKIDAQDFRPSPS